jgi:hypothetical protein
MQEHGPQNLGLVQALRPLRELFLRHLYNLGGRGGRQAQAVQSVEQGGDVLVLWDRLARPRGPPGRLDAPTPGVEQDRLAIDAPVLPADLQADLLLVLGVNRTAGLVARRWKDAGLL